MDERRIENILNHRKGAGLIHHFETMKECKIAQRLIEELNINCYLTPTYKKTWIGISKPACDLWAKNEYE